MFPPPRRAAPSQESSLVQLLQLGAPRCDVHLEHAEIVEIGVVQLVELGDVGQQPGLMHLQVGRDLVDLIAHALVVVDVLEHLVLDAEQALEPVRLVARVDVLEIELAQLLHHPVERVAGRPDVLGAHLLEHHVRDAGQLLLRLGAEEQDRLGVAQVDLAHRGGDLGGGVAFELELEVLGQLARRAPRGSAPAPGVGTLGCSAAASVGTRGWSRPPAGPLGVMWGRTPHRGRLRRFRRLPRAPVACAGPRSGPRGPSSRCA